MAILSEIAKRQALLPPDVERRLDDLGETARGLVDAMSDVVWSIDPRRDHLASLLLRVREHAIDVLEGTPLTFESPAGAETVHLSPQQRRQVYLILKEALTNAAKHARAQHVAVTAMANGDALEVEVRDDGCGFDPQALPLPAEAGAALDRAPERRPVSHRGNGLTNMRARARGLDGTLDIRSDSRGTTVRVHVPLARARRSKQPWAALAAASPFAPRSQHGREQRSVGTDQ